MPKGYMYILECSNGTYYTGSTKDLESRLQQHQNGQGANHTKKHLPVKLVYFEAFNRIDTAFYREKQVQGWSRKKKEALINGMPEKLHELAKCMNKTHYSGFGFAQPPSEIKQPPNQTEDGGFDFAQPPNQTDVGRSRNGSDIKPSFYMEKQLSSIERSRNIPQLRFPEFEGKNSYEKYIFKDIFQFSTGKNIKQSEASPVFKIPCVRYGELYYMYNEVILEVINRTNLDESDLLFS